MPASPSSAKARRPDQARASVAVSAVRPTSRGGRSRLAGTTARRAGSAAALRSMVASSSTVSAEGRVPSSSFSRASKRSKDAIAALQSRRR